MLHGILGAFVIWGLVTVIPMAFIIFKTDFMRIARPPEAPEWKDPSIKD